MEGRIKFKSKKGWILRDFVIAGLLLSGMIALVVLMIASVQNNYPGSDLTDPTFQSKYDKLTEISSLVELGRNTTASGEGFDFKGTFDVAFQSTFTVIQLGFATLSLFTSMGDSIIEDFAFLDSTVVTIMFILVMAIMTTIIVFVVISSISRSKL